MVNSVSVCIDDRCRRSVSGMWEESPIELVIWRGLPLVVWERRCKSLVCNRAPPDAGWPAPLAFLQLVVGEYVLDSKSPYSVVTIHSLKAGSMVPLTRERVVVDNLKHTWRVLGRWQVSKASFGHTRPTSDICSIPSDGSDSRFWGSEWVLDSNVLSAR